MKAQSRALLILSSRRCCVPHAKRNDTILSCDCDCHITSCAMNVAGVSPHQRCGRAVFKKDIEIVRELRNNFFFKTQIGRSDETVPAAAVAPKGMSLWRRNESSHFSWSFHKLEVLAHLVSPLLLNCFGPSRLPFRSLPRHNCVGCLCLLKRWLSLK